MKRYHVYLLSLSAVTWIKYEIAVSAVGFVISCRICLCDTRIKRFFMKLGMNFIPLSVSHLLRFKQSSRNNKQERFGTSAIKRFVGFS